LAYVKFIYQVNQLLLLGNAIQDWECAKANSTN